MDTSICPDCPFLDMPVELRLICYSYALLDARVITIGTAKLEGSQVDIVHRKYANNRSPFEGIPINSEPVIETAYLPELLSPIKPARISLNPATIDPPSNSYKHTQTAYHTLSHLCKQVNSELKSHFSKPSRQETSLFLQYPFGLHVFHTLTPHLLRQSKSVHIAGTHLAGPGFGVRSSYLPSPSRLGTSPDKLQGHTKPNSEAQLGALIKSMFGPHPTHQVEKLEVRMYYSGENAYNVVWSDRSPIVTILRNFHHGEMNMEVWRGNHGTGIYLSVQPTATENRVLSTVWRRLEEGGRRGEPQVGSWVVDPEWPAWKSEYEMSEGPEGSVLTS